MLLLLDESVKRESFQLKNSQLCMHAMFKIYCFIVHLEVRFFVVRCFDKVVSVKPRLFWSNQQNDLVWESLFCIVFSKRASSFQLIRISASSKTSQCVCVSRFNTHRIWHHVFCDWITILPVLFYAISSKQRIHSRAWYSFDSIQSVFTAAFARDTH